MEGFSTLSDFSLILFFPPLMISYFLHVKGEYFSIALWMIAFERKEVSGTYLGSGGFENVFMKNIITFLATDMSQKFI